jgi:DNA ligase (NAD+)
MSEKCPVCDESVVRPEGEVAYRCINKKCPAKKRENLYHFSSKKAFNIVGLGPKIIDVLFDQGLIQDAADLYDLKEGDLMPLERFAEKSSSNLVTAILESKNTSLVRLIYGLGIVHVGEETARVLAGRFQEHHAKLGKEQRVKNIASYFSSLTIDDLRQMPDIGPKVAQSIFEWFHDKTNIEFLEKLDKAGIMVIVERSRSGSAKLKGLSFVLTGELDTISRDMAKDKIRALGGDISESVSQKTSYVIVGKNPGSKYDKAKKLGIKIIDEEAFLKLIKDQIFKTK